MPLYEYECGSCGTRFERIQKFADAPMTVCPNCGGAVKRLMSSPAIQFKGSGFYITDYAKSGQAPAEGASDKTASTEGSSKGDKPAPAGSSGGADAAGTKESASKPTAEKSDSKAPATPAKPAASSDD